MLDIRIVRENPEYVKERVRLRGGDHWMLVDKVLECDVKRRSAETEKQALSQERNSSSKLIGQMMKEGRREEAEELKKRMSEVGDRIKELDAVASAAAEEQEAEEGFHFSDLKVIFTNKGFWLIAILCVLFYSGVFPFLKFATKLMIYKYNVDPELAGLIPAMLPFGTILLTPFFGSLYDRMGKGATLMVIGSVMLTLVHVLFALPILNEWWFAICVMIILGIAFSLVPSAMWPAVPKIIPMKQLGSAYAIIFYIQNIGLSMVPVLIGSVIQNYATIETAEGVTYDYTIPMSIFAVFGVIAICVAMILKRVDKTHGYGLEEPNIKK